jgi:biopolymer transport protein ExbD
MRLNPEKYSGKVRIEMLPLIDIVFLLLVFFIYAMLSMAVHYGQPVDLPDSSTATLDSNQALSITIQKNENTLGYFIDDQPVILEHLSERLAETVRINGKGDDQEVQIFADGAVSYQELYHVLDQIQGAGLHRISLQADPRQGK